MVCVVTSCTRLFEPLGAGTRTQTHQLGLANVQGSDPGDYLLLIDGLGEHRCSSPTSSDPDFKGVTIWGITGNDQNLVLVLADRGNNEGAHNVTPAPG